MMLLLNFVQWLKIIKEYFIRSNNFEKTLSQNKIYFYPAGNEIRSF